MMWVKETLPPRARRRWLLITIRLSAISLAGTERTLVAVGTASDASMFVTTRAEAPRSGTISAPGGTLGVRRSDGPVRRSVVDAGGALVEAVAVVGAGVGARAGPDAPLPPVAAVGVPAVGVPAVGVPAVGVPAVGVPAVGVPAVGVAPPGVPAVGVPAVGVAPPGVRSLGVPA